METHNMPVLRLIVGLGNPGEQYALTRHNVGFWFLDALAHHLAAPPWHHESKFLARVIRVIPFNQKDCWLLKPDTYMNLSGQSVAALAHFYKITPADILVVHDELDLPAGTARFKEGGGHNGHNGLKNIIAGLGNHDFWRLRVGIGRPATSEATVGYVLEKPNDVERQQIDQAIRTAVSVFAFAVEKNMHQAMQILHRHDG